MSINSKMEDYMVETLVKVRTASGSDRREWTPSRPIKVSIFKINEQRQTLSLKYSESTHTGLTQCKYIKANTNRLINTKTGAIYNILSAANDGRMTNLLLALVETDV